MPVSCSMLRLDLRGAGEPPGEYGRTCRSGRCWSSTGRCPSPWDEACSRAARPPRGSCPTGSSRTGARSPRSRRAARDGSCPSRAPRSLSAADLDGGGGDGDRVVLGDVKEGRGRPRRASASRSEWNPLLSAQLESERQPSGGRSHPHEIAATDASGLPARSVHHGGSPPASSRPILARKGLGGICGGGTRRACQLRR